MFGFWSRVNEEEIYNLVSTKSPKAVKVISSNKSIAKRSYSEGNTAFHYAAKFDNIEVLRCLIAINPQGVNQANDKGITPLHVAALCASLDFAGELIKANADVNVRDGILGSVPICGAIIKNRCDMLSLLIDSGAKTDFLIDINNRGLIFDALRANHIEIIKLLLDRGLSIELYDTTDGYTMLDGTVISGQDRMFHMLLQYRPNPNTRNKFGKSSLHYAAYHNRLDYIHYLIDIGANIESKDNYGFTPLHVACSQENVEMIKKLVDVGADINARSQDGHTPIHRCYLNGKWYSARQLIQLGARYEQEEANWLLLNASLSGDVVIVEKVVNEWPESVDIRNEQGMTPLMCACGKGHEAIVKLLIDRGAEINIKSKRESTPLSLAAYSSKNSSIINMLLINGADIEFALDVGDADSASKTDFRNRLIEASQKR